MALKKGAALTQADWQERWTTLTHAAETLEGLPLEPRVVLAVAARSAVVLKLGSRPKTAPLAEEDRRSLAVAAGDGEGEKENPVSVEMKSSSFWVLGLGH